MCICCGRETVEFEPEWSGEFCIDAVLIQVYLTGKSPTARQGRLTGDPSETVSDAMKETMTGFTINKKKYKIRSKFENELTLPKKVRKAFALKIQ